MFYQMSRPCTMDGKSDFIDISGKLHHFLQTKQIGIRTVIRTKSAAYQTILAVYYKESLMPDFSVCVHKGYLAVTTKSRGRLLVLTDSRALDDGLPHEITVSGDETGLRAWVDGRPAFYESEAVPYCEYGYVGFAVIGRGTLQDCHDGFFEGEILSMELSREPLRPKAAAGEELSPVPLFAQGMAGVENYRIPVLLTAPSGTVIAGADARTDAPGDNPNHICRAFRVSRDSAKSWEELRISHDFGGVGREDGAAAIDGQLVADAETGSVFQIYVHTANGVGSVVSREGTGFDSRGRRILTGRDQKLYYEEPDRRIVDGCGKDTGYRTDALDVLYRGGLTCGSVCHGDGAFQIMKTSYLQIIESRDGGLSWSEPRDLNFQVKKPWMCALGPGPGIGICKKREPHRGRLLCPVYFSNRHGVYTCAVIWSDDHGKTWTMGECVNDCRIWNGRRIDSAAETDVLALTGECQAAELPDGRVKMLMRNPYYQRAASAVSADGGETWQDFRIEDRLISPDCQFSLLETETDGSPCYLFAGPGHERLRVQGRLLASLDGMETWRDLGLLDCGEFGYSCMAALPDGSLGILYEGRNLTQYFMKIDLEERIRRKPLDEI